MSVDTTIAAWTSWLHSQSAPLSTLAIYAFSPPWPYEGNYPYLIILPRSQHLFRYSNEEVYYSGLYRLVYVDILSDSNDNVATLLEAAGQWFEDLKLALQDRNNPQNRSLGQAVDYVGENGDGPGFTVEWDEKQSWLSTDNIPIISLPCDVWVRELPELG